MAKIIRACDSVAGKLLNSRIQKEHTKALKLYLREIKEPPDIAFPRSYNEKMFWRRVFDHNPAFIAFCDKLATKKIFQALERPLPFFETLWVGEQPEDFPECLRRDDVVVKHSAGCSRNWFFARDGYDREAFLARCRKWLSKTYGVNQAEWAYGQVRSRLFAERALEADPKKLLELKVHLFGGEVFYTVAYIGEKTPNSLSAIFSPSGDRLTVTNSVVMGDASRALPGDFELPAEYDQAMHVSRQLAKDLDYVRVDFIYLNGQLYGGEITPYPTAGLMTNSDPRVMTRMGQCWDLGRSWFMRTRQFGWRAAYQRLLRRHIASLQADP